MLLWYEELRGCPHACTDTDVTPGCASHEWVPGVVNAWIDGIPALTNPSASTSRTAKAGKFSISTTR